MSLIVVAIRSAAATTHIRATRDHLHGATTSFGITFFFVPASSAPTAATAASAGATSRETTVGNRKTAEAANTTESLACGVERCAPRRTCESEQR
jgi:DNA-binding PucR family transcriptional regulator